MHICAASWWKRPAAFVLPALDAVGWDIATIFVALELGHYLSFLGRVVGIPRLVARYGRGAAECVCQCRDVIRANPVLGLYACLWPLNATRALIGTMRAPTRLRM